MPDNPHMGHRQRMLDKFRRFGLEIFSDHEVLEMLLYFAVRQGDTNPTAHRLMQRFGSLHAVLEATEDELQTVEGVGPRSAELLHLCFALFHRYQRMWRNGAFTDKLNTYDRIGAYFVPQPRRAEEVLLAAYVDGAGVCSVRGDRTRRTCGAGRQLQDCPRCLDGRCGRRCAGA
ncbi:MAG: helix-hairpin-helix domain-containing protein [Butyricicoccus sp.]